MQKWLKVALIVMIALLSGGTVASAEPVNNSVKYYYQHQKNNNEKDIAPTKNANSNSTASTVGITFWDFVRMILATIFVVALLYLLLKFINKKSKVYKSTQIVENLGGTTLGANRSVQIIKVGSQVFIVGVGENVQLLKEIEDTEERDQIITEYNNKMEQLIEPSDIVTKIVERAKKWQSSKNESSTFSSHLKKQLEDISKGRKKLFEELEKKGSDKQ
ncbi:MAG: flagellar biosynthetic protein FliO [Bacillota bacterium]|nr:flagellar biosynthetic protein FliO [Bacillota bacterium]